MKISTIFLLTSFIVSTTFAGGISGGGGGTVIPDAAGTQYIRNQLVSARTNLLWFLKYLSFTSDRKNLFEGNDNLLEKVKHYSLKVEMDGPCYDFDGKPTDGSVNSDSNTICLSAKTIGEKVSELTAYPQLLALMAHEYSHLLGYSEEEAVAFQLEVLKQTKYVDPGVVGFTALKAFRETDEWALRLLGWDNEFSKSFYLVIEQAESIDWLEDEGKFLAYDRSEANRVAVIQRKIENLRMYACTEFEADTQKRGYCKSRYEDTFRGADEIAIKDFHNYYGLSDLKPEGVLPNLVKNPSYYAAEIQFLVAELKSISEIMRRQVFMDIGFQ